MSVTVPRLATVPPPTVAPSEVESIAAYESLAAEYDSPAHETTRLLERASSVALERSGVLGALGVGSPRTVELGTGTGALTAALLKAQRTGRLLVSDPAPGMLRSALVKLEPISGGVALEPLFATAAETLMGLTGTPDLLVAGLCDPYLCPELLMLAKETSDPGTQMFVTVPGSVWAAGERSSRLGLPVDQTRFRLANGSKVHSKSTAFDEAELVTLFEGAELKPVRHGTVRIPFSGQRPTPEVAWCLAQVNS